MSRREIECEDCNGTGVVRCAASEPDETDCNENCERCYGLGSYFACTNCGQTIALKSLESICEDCVREAFNTKREDRAHAHGKH